MKEFKILHSKIFTPDKLKYHLIKGKRRYFPQTQRIIDKRWEKINKSGNSQLFNGRTYSLLHSEYRNNEIHYIVKETDYKSFVGTNLNNKPIQSDEMADILAVCTVVESSDNFIIVGKRSKEAGLFQKNS